MPVEFTLYPLNVGAGQIALSPIPGRSGSYEADLSALLHWSPDLVLTMTTLVELERMKAGDLGADLQAVGVVWRHLPIADFGAPEGAVQRAWPDVAAEVAIVLAQGGRVLIHCFGGCGRSGMAALRLMVEAGEEMEAALDRLRAVRPCAVETEAQLAWAFTSSA